MGVGICTKTETLAAEFLAEENGVQKPITECTWINHDGYNRTNKNERFIGVKWLRTCSLEDGYWEKGMTSLPQVAYYLTDSTTHDKVLEHFGIQLN